MWSFDDVPLNPRILGWDDRLGQALKDPALFGGLGGCFGPPMPMIFADI